MVAFLLTRLHISTLKIILSTRRGSVLVFFLFQQAFCDCLRETNCDSHIDWKQNTEIDRHHVMSCGNVERKGPFPFVFLVISLLFLLCNKRRKGMSIFLSFQFHRLKCLLIVQWPQSYFSGK